MLISGMLGVECGSKMVGTGLGWRREGKWLVALNKVSSGE